MSDLPDGFYAVMLINADPTSATTVPASSLGITSSSGTEYTYSNASPTIASGSFSGGSVPVPAESIVVLTSASGGPPPDSDANPDHDGDTNPDAHTNADPHGDGAAAR